MAVFCPYCDEEIGEAVHHTWAGDFLNWFEMKCPKCKQMLEIDVESEPVFTPHKQPGKDNSLTSRVYVSPLPKEED